MELLDSDSRPKHTKMCCKYCTYFGTWADTLAISKYRLPKHFAATQLPLDSHLICINLHIREKQTLSINHMCFNFQHQIPTFDKKSFFLSHSKKHRYYVCTVCLYVLFVKVLQNLRAFAHNTKCVMWVGHGVFGSGWVGIHRGQPGCISHFCVESKGP